MYVHSRLFELTTLIPFYHGRLKSLVSLLFTRLLGNVRPPAASPGMMVPRDFFLSFAASSSRNSQSVLAATRQLTRTAFRSPFSTARPIFLLVQSVHVANFAIRNTKHSRFKRTSLSLRTENEQSPIRISIVRNFHALESILRGIRRRRYSSRRKVTKVFSQLIRSFFRS